MYKFLSKNGEMLAFGVGIVITILFLIIAIAGVDGFNALGKEERGTTSIFNFGLYAAMALTVICGIAAIFFGLVQAISNPKGSLKGLIGIAALVIIFFIVRAMAGSDEPIQATIDRFNVSPGQSTYISGALWVAILMAIIAAVAFVLSEIRNFFK
ncbi:MAG: hypothetical protein GY705_15645 [Bacteroidetes bacterium]|nr:hypothetical protein [Bacteroidota bacterium]